MRGIAMFFLSDDPSRSFCYQAIDGTADAVLLAYCCGGGGLLAPNGVDVGWHAASRHS